MKKEVKVTLIGGSLDGFQKVVPDVHDGQYLRFRKYEDVNAHNIKLTEIEFTIEEYECKKWITPNRVEYWVAFNVGETK